MPDQSKAISQSAWREQTAKWREETRAADVAWRQQVHAEDMAAKAAFNSASLGTLARAVSLFVAAQSVGPNSDPDSVTHLAQQYLLWISPAPEPSLPRQ